MFLICSQAKYEKTLSPALKEQGRRQGGLYFAVMLMITVSA